jgi:cell division protein FtsQ
MLRKRTNKRKAVKPARPRAVLPKVRMPAINWGLVANTGLLAVVLCITYLGTRWFLDQEIESVRIQGRFERVSAMQVESAITPYLNNGFLSVDLRTLQNAIAALPWVEHASIRRSWPGTLIINVAEEKAAARWGDSGLLNVYGELFVSDVTHIPAELPRLSGPPGSELKVAERFFELDGLLKQRGLTAVSLAVDDRGAWLLTLNTGMQVRFGAVAFDERMVRFFAALDQVLAPVAETVDYVDMRYTNGFAVGWKPGAESRLADRGETDPHA